MYNFVLSYWAIKGVIMKSVSINLKKILFLIIFTLSFTSRTYGVELVNEQFTSNINGWSVTNVSKVYWSTSYSGSMFIDRNDRAWKTYNFGSSYANKTLDIEVRWCATNQWENNNDYLRVKVNDTVVHSDYDGGGCQNTTFTADTNGNGDFKIEFSPRTNSNNEDAYIQWFTVNYTPTTTTTWIKNGAGNSAYTAPSPYTNNVDITKH